MMVSTDDHTRPRRSGSDPGTLGTYACILDGVHYLSGPVYNRFEPLTYVQRRWWLITDVRDSQCSWVYTTVER